jgi:thioredoxin reductase (NADPH)
MTTPYDILIIGAGPIGLACALEAKQAGLRYAVIEKGTLVNSLYNYPANMTFFSTSERLEIGGIPFVSIQAKPTRNEALEYYRRVAESRNLEIRLFETVEAVQKHNGLYQVETSKGRYETEHLILATGFYDIPVRLGIPGEDLPKVTHYYKEPHFYFRQKVIVVGANNSAVDAALETWRKGADVTMVVREDEIGARVKYWARPDIVNRIKEGSIKAYFNSNLTAIRNGSADILTPDGPIRVENDYVIAATGYQHNFELLRRIGIQLSDDGKFYPSYDPTTQESNLPGIYLAGVVCGGMDTHVWFIENSRVHAGAIIAHIIDQRSRK